MPPPAVLFHAFLTRKPKLWLVDLEILSLCNLVPLFLALVWSLCLSSDILRAWWKVIMICDQVDLGSMVELNLLVVEQSQEASLKLFQDAGIVDSVQDSSHTNLVHLTDGSEVPINNEL